VVVKRGKSLFIYFRPFGEKIGVKVDTASKGEARQIEGVLLRTLRTGCYGALDPLARETCIRLFVNQQWEFPPEIGGPAPKPRKELTLKEASRIFLADPEVKDSKGRGRHECSILNLLEGLGEDRSVREIKVVDLKRYRVERQANGAAPATVNREIGTLSRIFSVLVEQELVEANPVRMLKSLNTKASERQVYLSHEDVGRIATLCPEWYQGMIWVAYYTGMRRGEITNLRRHQVDLGKRIITLRPTDTKEGAWKRIPLRHELVSILEDAMKVQALGSDLVFLVRDGKGVRPAGKDTERNPWKRALESLEWPEPRPRFHDLRATWRTNARRSGMHTDLEKEIMGHETRGRSVHERYGRISDQELVQAIDAMTYDHGDTEILVASCPQRASKEKGNKSLPVVDRSEKKFPKTKGNKKETKVGVQCKRSRAAVTLAL